MPARVRCPSWGTSGTWSTSRDAVRSALETFGRLDVT